MDKKSQHVGNHGGRYTDNDGMTKQFTYVDHDKKPKVSFDPDVPEKGWELKYRESVIQRITDQPASICPDIFHDFTLRGEGLTHVQWNKKMISDNGVPTSRLRDLCIILENTADIMGLTSRVIKTY